jgi:hypothetical protein
VVGFVDLAYARQFIFDGTSKFSFSLPATSAGNYLKISNFSSGSAAPVLYDLTNRKRYAANMDIAGVLQFVLPPSATDRNLVLLSEEVSAVQLVTNFTQRNFLNFATASNQGNYLIISNKILIGTAANGPVQQYAGYRNSAAGVAMLQKCMI